MTKKQSEKIAFITGITGQDGTYMAQFLLDKGYRVHGLIRRHSGDNTGRIASFIHNVTLHYGDLTDAANIIDLVNQIRPDEIYNFGAQSDVGISFSTPEYTADTDALGTLRLLEAIRILGLQKTTRFYQASSSELFGNADISPQNETTPFKPQSPYACAKLYAYWTVVNYRDAYHIHASNGILFNHESPLRGDHFVTQKICRAVADIFHGGAGALALGNLDAMRDWGHARDYIDGIWRILHHDTPDDYVLATGQSRSVRDFVEHAFAHIGITIQWQGSGPSESGVDRATGRILVSVDPAFYRPNDVHTLCGDAAKARKILGWQAKTSFDDLMSEMMEAALCLRAETTQISTATRPAFDALKRHSSHG